jgi:hypothetical protein
MARTNSQICLLAVVALGACGGRVGDAVLNPDHMSGDGGIMSTGAPDSAESAGARHRTSCGPNGHPQLLGLMTRDDLKVELRSIDPSTGRHVPYPDPKTPNVLGGVGPSVGSPDLVADNLAGRLYALDRDSQRIVTIEAKSGAVIRATAIVDNTYFDPHHLFLTASGALLALFGERIEAIDAELGTHAPYPNFGTMYWEWAGLSLMTHAYDDETGHLYLVSQFHGLIDISIPDGSVVLGEPIARSIHGEPSPVADCVGMSLRANQLIAVCPSWSLQSIGGSSFANFPNPLVPNPVVGMNDASIQGSRAEASDPDSSRLYLMGTTQHDDGPQLFVIDTSGKAASTYHPLGNLFQAFTIICR